MVKCRVPEIISEQRAAAVLPPRRGERSTADLRARNVSGA